MGLQLQSLAGLLVIPLIAWLLSERRVALKPLETCRLVMLAILMQLVIAGTMLNVGFLRDAFEWPARLVGALQAATNEGMRFAFGYLAGGPQPFDVTNPQDGFVLALQALPIVLLMSVLSRLLYHWGVLQKVVAAFAFVLRRALGVGGPVGTAAAANVFVGMVEAPLLIRPYVGQLSRSQLFSVMTVGMATIAGTVLALYASVLEEKVPGAAGHLIVASVISLPAALMLSLLMVPGEPPSEDGPVDMPTDGSVVSSMDAIAQGTQDGIQLLASITAMLVVMLALIALGNQALALAGQPFGIALTLEQIAGWIFAPLVLIIGIPWSECLAAGELVGIKTVANELIAYLRLAGEASDTLSERSRLILTYALSGFANLGSAGILVGGLVAIAPHRRSEIAELGLKSIVAGTLATLLTGAVIGVLTPG
ncbi:MAG: hypothetical protein RLZ98_473 [Pseudomonadota bacterium]|jgi:CNT family concentrative nucleoside transporter